MTQRIVLLLTLYFGLVVSVAAQQATPSALDDVRLEQQLSLLRSMLLEQDRTLNQLQRELNLLRGENEVLNHELTQLKQQQQQIYLDLDQRLRALNSTAITPSPDTAAPATDLTRFDPPPATASAPSAPNLMPNLGSNSTSPPLAALPPQFADMNEKSLYQEGFKQVRTDQFSQAITIFQHLLTRYPQGEYADNAQYWIAESYYALREFDAAIQAFNMLIERFPDSAKRPHSLLKIGYAYFEQQDYVSARSLLEQVKTAYPNSSTARLAQARLDRLAELGF
jgi:tol-pal system protein YbgF